MDKVLCFKKFESADVKYRSTVLFRVTAQKYIRQVQDNFGAAFKKAFSARNIKLWRIEGAQVKHDNSFFRS